MQKIKYKDLYETLNSMIINEFENGANLDQAKKSIIETFFLLRKKRPKTSENLKNVFIEIIVGDSLKYLIYKQKLGIISLSESEVLSILFQLKKIELIEIEVLTDLNLFSSLIGYYIELMLMRQSTKIIVNKALIPCEKETIVNMIPNYQEIINEKTPPITLELLLNEIVEMYNEYIDISPEMSQQLCITYLSNLISLLFNCNKENSMFLLCELSQVYYGILKQLNNSGLQLDGMKEYFLLFENFPENRIVETIINNKELLISILWIIRKILIEQNYEGFHISLNEIIGQDYESFKKRGRNKEE